MSPVAINIIDMMNTEHDTLRHGGQCKCVQSLEEEEAMELLKMEESKKNKQRVEFLHFPLWEIARGKR